jgi:LacI family transcriptional regulator
LPRVTMADVAADAGVSKATVSMVLNENPLVAESTRQRVQEALVRLGYVYNSAAASLRKNKTNAIGFIITTLKNPYFAEFAESLQAELDARGMDVLLGVSGDDVRRQNRLVLSMAGRRVDGIVMVPAQGTDPTTITSLEAPVLLLARRVSGLVVDYVGGDNEAGAAAATDHLIEEHGCRQLGFFGGTDGSSARIERLAGYGRALAAHELPIDTGRQLPCPADRSLAREQAHDFLTAQPYDAVVCYNDVIALGVMDAAAELGLVVGRDLRVTGFDDIEGAAFAAPPLTSVSVPAALAGREASAMLLARINGDRPDAGEVILETTLQRRASCGCDGAIAGVH